MNESYPQNTQADFLKKIPVSLLFIYARFLLKNKEEWNINLLEV